MALINREGWINRRSTNVLLLDQLLERVLQFSYDVYVWLAVFAGIRVGAKIEVGCITYRALHRYF